MYFMLYVAFESLYCLNFYCHSTIYQDVLLAVIFIIKFVLLLLVKLKLILFFCDVETCINIVLEYV